MKRICTTLILLGLTILVLRSQNISINTDGSPPDPSAILDIQSNSRGLLIPRMSKDQRNLINTPAAGLLIYQTDNLSGLYMYNGTQWDALTTATNVWSTSGNTTVPGSPMLGTLNDYPLQFTVNNASAGILGNSIVALGRNAMPFSFPFMRSVAIGANALRTVVGGENVAVGYGGMENCSSCTDNTAIGNYAMNLSFSGLQNVAIGHSALRISQANNNVAIGYRALTTNTSGYENIAVGKDAMLSNVDGIQNVAVGTGSLFSNTGGNDNTSIGTFSLYYNTQGIRNTAVGRAALQNNTDHYNTAIGYKAAFATTSGTENTVVGARALESNTTGSSNVAIGKDALRFSNSYSNVGIGYSALFDNTSGHENIAIGTNTLTFNVTGERNTAVGSAALSNNINGIHNVAVGYNALIIGNSGNYNVALGSSAGTTESLYNTVSIGNGSYLNGDHNQVFIGSLLHDFIGGNVGWSTFSDARVKSDIREDVVGLEFIKKLRPVTYHRDIDVQAGLTGNTLIEDYPNKYDIEKIKFSGFLAQEVEAAAQESGYDFSGVTAPSNDRSVYTLRYESFVVPMVKAMQEQQAIIDKLILEVDQLKSRLADMDGGRE